MNIEEYVLIASVSAIFLIIVILVAKKIPRKLRQDYFKTKWNNLQQRCSDESQWAQAIIEADDLLHEALKKKRFKGKNMGERMVAAQKVFSNNDAVWFGHKLRTKLDMNPELNLPKQDVQKALYGLRQGLKDMGAL